MALRLVSSHFSFRWLFALMTWYLEQEKNNDWGTCSVWLPSGALWAKYLQGLPNIKPLQSLSLPIRGTGLSNTLLRPLFIYVLILEQPLLIPLPPYLYFSSSSSFFPFLSSSSSSFPFTPHLPTPLSSLHFIDLVWAELSTISHHWSIEMYFSLCNVKMANSKIFTVGDHGYFPWALYESSEEFSESAIVLSSFWVLDCSNVQTAFHILVIDQRQRFCHGFQKSFKYSATSKVLHQSRRDFHALACLIFFITQWCRQDKPSVTPNFNLRIKIREIKWLNTQNEHISGLYHPSNNSTNYLISFMKVLPYINRASLITTKSFQMSRVRQLGWDCTD